MELKIGQWYLHPGNGRRDPYRLVKITGFRFNVVEFEDCDAWNDELPCPQFAQTYTDEVERRPGGVVTLPAEYSGYYVADLCECCLFAMEYGASCPCEDGTDQHPSGLMGLLEGEEITAGLFAEEHDSKCLEYLLDSADVPNTYECGCEETDHSTLRCDGCGSFLHGKRYKATGWVLRKGNDQ